MVEIQSLRDLELKEQMDGTKMHPGLNVGIGSDDTLYAKITGTMKVERLGRDKKKISVYPVEEKKTK